MANGKTMVDGQLREMTDAEQAEYDARNTAWDNDAPNRRMGRPTKTKRCPTS